MIDFGNDWNDVLSDLINGDEYKKIREFLKTEYSFHDVYPPMDQIFNAFKLTPYGSVKCVILGQDPYHEPGEAHGLCFSVTQGTKMPPSLQNIYKELKSDLNIDNGLKTDLTPWAKQGVFLLNTTLTVRRGQANSHQTCGWTYFTDEVIKLLNARSTPIVFILWGRNARNKKAFIDTKKHLVLESAHPSPLSAYNGFFGCKHFSKTNDFLIKNGFTPVNWQL